MRVIGIVAEYNPFHNGHLYQINRVKEMYADSVIIVAISGYFTERGEVSVLSKWDKTSIALEYGVDIVLEIPFVFSVQSADIFSYAAIKMFSEFKVDTIVFGSESNDLDLLINTAKVQIDNPIFDDKVKEYLSNGENYPTSLSKAIRDLSGNCVSESNDILAVSYIKEILKNNYSIDIVPIKRTNSYLDTTLDDSIVSASNVRKRFKNGEDVSKYVPNGVNSFLRNIDYDLFFSLIRYKIISLKNDLDMFHLVSEGFENRLYESAIKCTSFEDFLNTVKTKRYTHNKINRILINIFLGFTKKDSLRFKSLEYIRILGMSKDGRKYFSSIKGKQSLPVITKFEKFDMLQEELKVTTLYSILVNDDSLVLDEIKKHVILK